MGKRYDRLDLDDRIEISRIKVSDLDSDIRQLDFRYEKTREPSNCHRVHRIADAGKAHKATRNG